MLAIRLLEASKQNDKNTALPTADVSAATAPMFRTDTITRPMIPPPPSEAKTKAVKA